MYSFIAVVAAGLKVYDVGHQGEHEVHAELAGHGEHGGHIGHVEHVEYVQHEPLAHQGDTALHHEVEHKHATSHQSVKIHHYHPVPVYIKKEDQELIKKPVEIGGTKQKLKIIHPETEKNHNHGAVLEEHSESKFHKIGHYEEPHLEHYEHYSHH